MFVMKTDKKDKHVPSTLRVRGGAVAGWDDSWGLGGVDAPKVHLAILAHVVQLSVGAPAKEIDDERDASAAKGVEEHAPAEDGRARDVMLVPGPQATEQHCHKLTVRSA